MLHVCFRAVFGPLAVNSHTFCCLSAIEMSFVCEGVTSVKTGLTNDGVEQNELLYEMYLPVRTI